MSTIDTTGIDETKPTEGQATTQSVRDNTSAVKTQLGNAKTDIESAESRLTTNEADIDALETGIADLSGVTDAATARTNLSVYSTTEADALVDDLSGVTDAATARTNLDVYSTSEAVATAGDTMTGALTWSANYVLKATGNNSRALLQGAATPSTSTGAYISLEGADYGGAGAGGNVILSTVAGKQVTVSAAGVEMLGSTQLNAAGALTRKDYVDSENVAQNTVINGKVARAGDSGIGRLRVTNTTPVNNDELTSKLYVDNAVAGVGSKVAKYVRFAGSATPTIRSQLGVSSITRLAVGRWRVNFNGAMPNSVYPVLANVGPQPRMVVTSSITTTSVEILTYSANVVLADVDEVHVMVLG
jgi:hypothetical protein